MDRGQAHASACQVLKVRRPTRDECLNGVAAPICVRGKQNMHDTTDVFPDNAPKKKGIRERARSLDFGTRRRVTPDKQLKLEGENFSSSASVRAAHAWDSLRQATSHELLSTTV